MLTAAHGFALWKAMAVILGGWVEVQRGRARYGIAAMERGLDAYRATGARMVSTYFLAFLAEAHWSAGACDAGLAVASEGLVLTETTLDRGYEPELWRLMGELLLASQEPADGSARSAPANRDTARDEAERCFLRSLACARASQAKSLELRTATSLARAWQMVGRAADARGLLDEVCEWFGTAESADLSDARNVLGSLTRRGVRTRDGRRGAGPTL